MSRVVLSSYTARFAVGGYLSWTLQWLRGLQRLGHDVYFVEKVTRPRACYDVRRDEMTDDCSYGVAALASLLERFGLGGRWCFVDAAGTYHGLPRRRVETILRTADVFLDTVGEGAWAEEAADAGVTVFLDGEAGYCQIGLEQRLAAGGSIAEYDRYYTVGLNVGTERSSAPTAGLEWHSFFDPVDVGLFDSVPPARGGAYTTIMSWRTHAPITYQGRTYRQKDVEFPKFLSLPERVGVELELAVGGKNVPTERLARSGWNVRDALSASVTYDAWCDYIAASRGEFSVVKNVFVETWSGWFSDRSAIYLASGRPVVLQDTGWSEHLPTGEGLFAPRNVDEAAAAIETIESDYERHSRRAREIAREYLATDRVLPRLLEELAAPAPEAAVAR